MDLNSILPIIGVIVGWLLKEISDYFKQRNKERKEIGTALTGLLELHNELRRLKTHLEDYKDRTNSWEDYETFRMRTAKRYMKRTDPVETIRVALDLLSSIRPLQAINLQDATMLIDYFSKLDLNKIQSDEGSYIKWLSTFEVIFELSEKTLKRLIIKLAWLHGSITYIRLKLSWRRYKKGTQKSRDFRKKMLDEIYKTIEKQNS